LANKDFKNKHILLCCLGCDRSKAPYLNHLHSLGIRITVVDEPHNPLGQENRHLFTRLVEVDIKGPHLLHRALSVVKSVHKEDPFDGVMTFWDDAILLAGAVAEELGLPGNKLEALNYAKDKHLTRTFLHREGLPCPSHMKLRSYDELDRAIASGAFDNYNFPLIVKPSNAGSSIAVEKAKDLKTLRTVFARCLNTLQEHVQSGDLMGMSGQFGLPGSQYDLVIEEYLHGPEIDVDVVLDGRGNAVYAECTDDWPMAAPWFCETGCHSPSSMPERKLVKIRECAIVTLQRMGMTHGVFHVEVIYDERKGPTIVEVNARVGGGPIWGFHKTIWGVDLLTEAVIACIGKRNRPAQLPAPASSCVTMVFHARESGVLENSGDDCLEQCGIKQHPSVIMASGQAVGGDQVTAWCDGFPTSLARVDLRCDGMSVSKAIKLAEGMRESFFEVLKYSSKGGSESDLSTRDSTPHN